MEYIDFNLAFQLGNEICPCSHADFILLQNPSGPDVQSSALGYVFGFNSEWLTSLQRPEELNTQVAQPAGWIRSL